jgi:hypothetical protein
MRPMKYSAASRAGGDREFALADFLLSNHFFLEPV